MAYTKRSDKRKFEDVREMKAEIGVVKRANGSAMFSMGKTVAIAAVYAHRNAGSYPTSKMDSAEKGVLNVVYDLLSFSVTDRKRPGPSRRSTEVSMVIQNALAPVLDLSKVPNTRVDLYVYITQADAGTRTAAINAASLALADAGLTMKDLVASVAVGKVGDKICVDLTKEEEDWHEGATDLPIAMINDSEELTLLQMDGDMTREEIVKALEMGKVACKDINKMQVKALKDKYPGDKK